MNVIIHYEEVSVEITFNFLHSDNGDRKVYLIFWFITSAKMKWAIGVDSFLPVLVHGISIVKLSFEY